MIHKGGQAVVSVLFDHVANRAPGIALAVSHVGADPAGEGEYWGLNMSQLFAI